MRIVSKSATCRAAVLSAGIAVALCHAAPASAQFVVPRITLQVADWLPTWDASAGGGWGVVPEGKAPGEWTAFSGSARQLSVPEGRYDVYWVERTGMAPLGIAAGVVVGPAGAAVSVNTGVKLAAADWAHLDGTAHWAAMVAGSSPIAESTGNAMMLPVGDYDLYWKAGDDVGFGWVTRVNIAPPSGGMGVQVQALPEGVRVLMLTPGGAAERAGLRVGDLITAVDGKTLIGLDASSAIGALRGPPSSSAAFTVLRGSAPATITITRDAQAAVPVVTMDSGVRLVGKALDLGMTGWWGAVFAGSDVSATIPVNRSRDSTKPLPLPPGTYDLYWRADDAPAPVLIAKGVAVQAGKLVEAAAPR